MPILHTCLLPNEDEEEAQERQDMLACLLVIQEMKQYGEWDRGPEYDS